MFDNKFRMINFDNTPKIVEILKFRNPK